MLYVLALLFPPLACIGAGKFWHFILNTIFCATLIGIPIAWIHAWCVVKGSYREIAGTRVYVNYH